MSTGLWLILGAVAATALRGLGWGLRQGRVRAIPAAALPAAVTDLIDPAAAVTLVLLTSPICARCPQARRLLDEVAAATPGMRRTELDLAADPGLPDALGVRSTPTTLALSPAGRELFRVIGVPRADRLGDALAEHLPPGRAVG